MRKNILDYLIILIVGLVIFLFFYFQGAPNLSEGDEIVYAVMGRNIAVGRGVISNFYAPLSIVEKGYPLGDVHMPGYSLILGLSFWLLGGTEFAAFFPNYVSYLVCGLLLFWIGKTLFNRWAGYAAALLFYLFPSIIAFTFTAMPEITLTLLSIIYFLIWYRCLVTPRWYYAIFLAVTLMAGLLHRETFLLFLPLSFYILWIWPQQARLKVSALFGGLFILLFIFVFLPFSAERSPYPQFLNQHLIGVRQQNYVGVMASFFVEIKKNLQDTFTLEWYDWQRLVYQLQFLLGLSIIFMANRFDKTQKAVVGYTVYSFIAMFIGILWIYPLGSWAGLRVFIYLMPPVLVLIGGFLSTLNSNRLKYGLTLLICGLFFAGSLILHQSLQERRQGLYERARIEADIIDRNISRFQSDTILTYYASDHQFVFLYGWEHFPVTIVWSFHIPLEYVKQLEQQIIIDTIVVDNEFYKSRIIDGIANHVFATEYELIAEDQGHYFFVSKKLHQ